VLYFGIYRQSIFTKAGRHSQFLWKIMNLGGAIEFCGNLGISFSGFHFEEAMVDNDFVVEFSKDLLVVIN